MNVRSAAAVLMVLFWTSSFAPAADRRDAPPNGLLFPESVEQAMMGERPARRLDRLKNSTAIELEFEHQSGPLSQLLSAPNSPKSNSKPVPSAQQDAPAASDASPNQDDYPELKEAMQPLVEGKVDEALKILHEAARKHPLLPSEYVILYHVFVRTNQRDQARSWLEKAIVETPCDPEPWIIVGEFALNEKRFGEAELDFEKAKELLIGYSNADRKQLFERELLNDFARVSEGREQWPEAQARLDEYLKKSPDDLVGWQRLARAQFMQAQDKQRVEDAYKSLQRAKQIDVKNAEKTHSPEKLLPAAALLGQYYDAVEQNIPFRLSKNALNMFRFALTHNPDNEKLRYVVGIWALENGETELAKEQASQFLRIGKNPGANVENLDGLMLNGIVALWEKRWAVAEGYFTKAFLAEPNRFDVRNYLALALIEQNISAKKDKALAAR